MATTKLTLSVDRDTIEIAKRVASDSNMSVSKLFKKLITEVSRKRKTPDALESGNEKIPGILTLAGILKGKVADDIDLQDAKYQYLKGKYEL